MLHMDSFESATKDDVFAILLIRSSSKSLREMVAPRHSKNLDTLSHTDTTPHSKQLADRSKSHKLDVPTDFFS